jgi:hydrogenase expression/formation protein HypE
MAEGKIPQLALKGLLAGLTRPGRDVVVGPVVGEDACVVDPQGRLLVASSDPVTFTVRHAGYYSVNVNANDVAAMGARPRWFLATLLFPPDTPLRGIRPVFKEIDRACAALGIRLVGGHTEVTSKVTHPVIAGTMLGTVGRRRLVRPRTARPDDRILITKRIALEGTSIIARERRREVDALLGRRRAAGARRLLFEPGISVVKEAMAAVRAAPVHAMHDPTEGGLYRGVEELAAVTGIGARIDLDRVPVFEETEAICRGFGIDPMGLIASGSLLIVVSPRHAGRVSDAVRRRGIECRDIGSMKGRRLTVVRGGRTGPFPKPGPDEITKVL